MTRPPRDATQPDLDPGSSLVITFDVDLGELIDGHHVVARGISRGRRRTVPRHDAGEQLGAHAVDIGSKRLWVFDGQAETERLIVDDELLYEFVPGIEGSEEIRQWGLAVFDDVGTEYRRLDVGEFERNGGPSSKGTRDLGGPIPPAATRLWLYFSPGPGWQPHGVWRTEIELDLAISAVVAAR